MSWGIHFTNAEELASVGRVRQEESRKGDSKIRVARVLATEARGDPGEIIFKEMAEN